MSEISFRGVGKTYGDGTVAVRSVDLEVSDGEFMVLVGPSGCGKSTLLRMLAGLEVITEGEILIDGEVVNKTHPRDRDVAMVFQNYALYPHMSVFANMAFPLRQAKKSKAEIAERVEEVARVLQLTEHLKRRPANLSGGQRQRVAIGRAIVREPKAFLLDEPLSNLDAKLRVQMRGELAQLHTDLGVTTIFVTHDQTEAMTLGQRVAVLSDGELHQVGTPRDLYYNPDNLFVAGFIGSPSMNLLSAELQRSGEDWGLALGDSGCWPVTQKVAGIALSEESGRNLIVGVRPESILLLPPGDAETAGMPRGRVRLTEVIEPEMYVYVEGGFSLVDPSDPEAGASRTLVARLPSSSSLDVGDEVVVGCEAESLHLFSPEGGRAL